MYMSMITVYVYDNEHTMPNAGTIHQTANPANSTPYVSQQI